jgi:hypothetical protein
MGNWYCHQGKEGDVITDGKAFWAYRGRECLGRFPIMELAVKELLKPITNGGDDTDVATAYKSTNKRMEGLR